MRKIIIVIFIALLITGCGARIFSPRESNPVLEDYLGSWPNRKLGTMATTAGHRIVTYRMSNGKAITENNWQAGEFCAEPPPDAMVSLTAAFKNVLELEADIPSQGSGKLKSEFVRNISTIMAPLLRRSQGLQWNRDNLSFLCNAYLNRMIKKDQFHELMVDVMTKSHTLIENEIKNLPKLDFTFQKGDTKKDDTKKDDTKKGDTKKDDTKKDDTKKGDTKKDDTKKDDTKKDDTKKDDTK